MKRRLEPAKATRREVVIARAHGVTRRAERRQRLLRQLRRAC